MLKQLIEVLISGITLGSVYAVMALGLTIVYGVSRIFNLAYGSFFTWGAYLAWFLTGVLHLNYFLVFPIMIPTLFLLGVGTDRLLIYPLRKRPDWQTTTIFLTLGLALFLDNLALVVFGPFIKSLPPLFTGTFKIKELVISINTVGIFVISIILMVFIELFLGKNKIGMAMRAVSQDQTGAKIVGIPINNIFSYAFGFSIVLVGITSVLVGSFYFISPLGGWEPFIKAFVVVAFGGLGSTKGALVGAFILGILEALISWKIGPVWVIGFWFLILLLTLIIRPSGLFGKWG
ncbi:MAG: branched-chain amino acid ABC transporter permease [Actinobacteria bacterium]|nr:branched-chain amino acid ABC transporter permease [Actinomycetota bacterium]MCL5070787.1 branched-chain amino acid ABC transporter permease [Actinomycetota bacterium]